MNLKSGYPFWLVKNGLPFEYPKLEKDIKTEVAILGGGISGALTAFHLTEAGIECVVVDARTIGLGSTCASTAILQYEIDVPLSRLAEKIGTGNAITAYRLCGEAINSLYRISKKIGLKDFHYVPSLFYAATKKDVSLLKEEINWRRQAGFEVDWLDPQKIKEDYHFSAPAALLSQLGAQADPYSMTHLLHQHTIKKGGKVFDRTSIISAQDASRGIRLKTGNGFTITAKKVVYATGYEVTEMLHKKIVTLHTTYAAISEPLTTEYEPWKDNALIWNTADPYLYMRFAPGNRVLVGGRDQPFTQKNMSIPVICQKEKQLTADFKKLHKHIPFKPEFSWGGVFGSTADGLPYIGAYKKYPHAYFALGFGGNGITFSLIAAEIIRDIFLGRKHRTISKIFSFDR